MRYNNVSKWVEKYGLNHQKGVRLVVEMDSETKKLIALQVKIAELERVVGQKQLLIDFQSKMIELAEQEYGIDIKKNAEFCTFAIDSDSCVDGSCSVVDFGFVYPE